MCSSYWNLDVPNLICPKCGEKVSESFQTHFNGNEGDCLNYYKLNEPIPNLKGIITGKLSDYGDWFSAGCDNNKCKGLDYDGIIREGAIVEVIPIEERK